MNNLNKHFLHIILTVPLLLYLGISIIVSDYEPVYFNYLVLVALFLVFVIHLSNFIYLYKKMQNGGKFEKIFGILLILIAVLILVINIFEIVRSYKNNIM